MSLFKKSKQPKKETGEAPVVGVTEKPHTPGKRVSREVIVRPHVSEKAQQMQAENQYAFWVTDDANKSLVREEIERSYGVHVVAVNILRKKAKPKYFRNIQGRGGVAKKAIVTLREGEKLNIT